MAHAVIPKKAKPASKGGLVLSQSYLTSIREQFQECPLRHSDGMHVMQGEHILQTKYVSWSLAHLANPIEVLHITDVQWGHILCRKDKVREYIDWVLADPYRYIVFGGDMIDAGNRLSVGSPWEQECEPQGEIYTFCEEFARVRHRILGYVGGNHERRGIPTFGDLGSLISHILEIPYSAGRQFLDFNFKGGSLKMDLWHGRGAARTAGAKMNMLHEFMKSGDAQVYLVGHLHDAITKHDWRIVRSPRTNKVKLMKVAGAMSSSFLDYFGSYTEVAGLPPSGLLMARTIIEPDGKFELTLR